MGAGLFLPGEFWFLVSVILSFSLLCSPLEKPEWDFLSHVPVKKNFSRLVFCVFSKCDKFRGVFSGIHQRRSYRIFITPIREGPKFLGFSPSLLNKVWKKKGWAAEIRARVLCLFPLMTFGHFRGNQWIGIWYYV